LLGESLGCFIRLDLDLNPLHTSRRLDHHRQAEQHGDDACHRKVGQDAHGRFAGVPDFSGVQGGPIEANIKLAGRVLPCRISK